MLTPYLCCRDAAKAIDFYIAAFGAKELSRLTEPGGRIGHAEVAIADAVLFLSGEYGEIGYAGPEPGKPTAVTLHLMVPDVDAVVTRAVELGATVARQPKDEFYGHRAGVIIDPFGHRWMLATEIEQVSAEEIVRRFKEMTGAA